MPQTPTKAHPEPCSEALLAAPPSCQAVHCSSPTLSAEALTWLISCLGFGCFEWVGAFGVSSKSETRADSLLPPFLCSLPRPGPPPAISSMMMSRLAFRALHLERLLRRKAETKIFRESTDLRRSTRAKLGPSTHCKFLMQWWSQSWPCFPRRSHCGGRLTAFSHRTEGINSPHSQAEAQEGEGFSV